MTRRRVNGWGGERVESLRERWGRDDVAVYGTVDSTNDVARELADGGAPAGTIVLARAQSEGRGRAGATWESPEDAGIYLSMLFRPRVVAVPALAAIIAGVDVAIALASLGAGLRPRVKWPNDLMVDDRKLGGILAEASHDDHGAPRLVVGVGVNVLAGRLPAGLEGAAAVDEYVEDPRLVDVADAVVRGLERRLPDPPQVLDESALDELDRLDWLRNRRIRHKVREGEPVEGVAAGIAPDGALLLRPDRGALRRVVAGSVQLIDQEGT